MSAVAREGSGWVLPATALRRAFDDMVGRTQVWLVDDTPGTFAELLELYGGSTAAIASAAGYGTARAPRAVNGLSRESFMRSLRRYRQGARIPTAERQRLFSGIVQRERRRRATPNSLGQVVALALRHGLTWWGLFTVDISEDEGMIRHVTEPGWWISPDVIDEEGLAEPVSGRHWDAAVEPFNNCFSTSYIGGPGMTLNEVETLVLRIGRRRGSQVRAL